MDGTGVRRRHLDGRHVAAPEQRRVRHRLDLARERGGLADDDRRAEVREPAGRGGHGVEQRVLDDEHVRGGRVDEVLEEGAAVVDVDGNLHGAEPGGREPPDHELGAVAEHQEDAVTVPDAEAREPGSDDLGFGRRLGVGQLPPAEREREEGPVGVRERLLREQPGEGPAGAVGDDEAHR